MQIYIHIPFCLAKCKYCAFNSIVSNSDIIEKYIKTLCKEIRQSELNQKISTIYFGGGTPSILTARQFADIFESLNEKFNLNDCNEITVEANPGTDLTYDYLAQLQKFGVNRLSLGVQSFDDNLLKTLGRIHSSIEAIKAINLAKLVFENVSIDLMYDLPHQTPKILRETITTALKMKVQHISIYGLEVEESTEFGRLNEIGQLNLPNDDESNEMYEYIMSELPKNGFNRYEISNFAKSGFESQHNLGYWSDVPYIGFGAGAHSYFNEKIVKSMETLLLTLHSSLFTDKDFGVRFSNVANVSEYIKGVDKCLEEIVTKERAIEEFCFLSLRKAEGIDIAKFKFKFGEDINSLYSKVIDKLNQQGLIEIENSHIKLTNRGMKYGNYVFSEFLLSETL